MNDRFDLEYARSLDASDPLASFRQEFYIPILHVKESIYFCGNALGLQPKNVQDAVWNELEDWANFGVEGYSYSRNHWMDWQSKFPPLLSEIVGGREKEIAIMGQLTANLHFMMATFYRPSGKRKKILIEQNAFSSDKYVVVSQLQLAGYSAENELIEVMPSGPDNLLSDEDIIQAIRKAGDELALVLVGGVNYLTGQVLDMKAITEAAHEAGAFCGFDLAHAVGNVELKMHDWDVDFACWCSYKYLNSGPGSIGGIFIHEKHTMNETLPRLTGWWGTDEEVRFRMEKKFIAATGAEGWQLSMPPVLSMAVHMAALQLFERAGVHSVFEKGKKLSAYLLFILNEILDNSPEKPFDILTPFEEGKHGCQISLKMGIHGKHQFDKLRANGVIASWLDPNVVRITPVPLYNTFEEVFNFGKILEHILHNH